MASVLKVDTIKSLAGNEAMTITEGGVPLLKVPAFSVSTDTTASFTNGTLRKIPYDTVEFDTHSWFDTVNNRYTPQIAGYYSFSVTATGTGTSATFFVAQVFKNDVSYINLWRSRVATSSSQTFTGSTMLYLNGTTDYVEIFIRVDASSGVAYTTPNIFSGFLVGGA
jgi:hypothetical protein